MNVHEREQMGILWMMMVKRAGKFIFSEEALQRAYDRVGKVYFQPPALQWQRGQCL